MSRVQDVCVAVTVALLSLPLRGQDAVSCKGMDEVISELQQLRTLIAARPNPVAEPKTLSATVAVGDAPFLGSKEAPVTIVEFTDYQCPFCERFYKETFPPLKKIYIDTGKVRFYVMDLPLVELHKNALVAAQAAHCAGDQGQFWAMHDRMQSNPSALAMANLVDYATEFGLDVDVFRKCVDGEKFRSEIEKGASEVKSMGARGTPAFLVGRSTPEGAQGEFIIGAEPFGNFEKKIAAFTK